MSHHLPGWYHCLHHILNLLLYCGMPDRASAKKFFPAGTYFSLKLNLWKYWAHWTCLGDSFLGGCRASRFLSLDHTSNGFAAPSSRCRHIRRTHHTAKAFLSQTAHPLSIGISFLEVYVQDCRPPWFFFCSRTTPTATSACTTKDSVGLGCFNIGSQAKNSFNFLNAFRHSCAHGMACHGHGFLEIFWCREDPSKGKLLEQKME